MFLVTTFLGGVLSDAIGLAGVMGFVTRLFATFLAIVLITTLVAGLVTGLIIVLGVGFCVSLVFVAIAKAGLAFGATALTVLATTFFIAVLSAGLATGFLGAALVSFFGATFLVAAGLAVVFLGGIVKPHLLINPNA